LIPDVIGMTKEDAKNTLKTAGFNDILIMEGEDFEENSNEKDKIFSQTPVSGTLCLNMILIKIGQQYLAG